MHPSSFALASVALALTGTLSAAPVLADNDPIDDAPIDEIVVVANRDARPVKDVAALVTVIGREDIDAGLAASVADIFRYTPGIDQESAGTRFGDEGINIRGIGGNRVAVLVDGVPLGDQFGVGSFSNATRDFLNAGLVKRIEVLHGPASALYGSAAIGGVIAVTTPEPSEIAGRNTSGGDLRTVWRGADDSIHGTALLAHDRSNVGLLLGGSVHHGQETDSAAVADPLDFRNFRRRSALAKLVVDDQRGDTWRLSLLHQDASVASDLNALLGSGRYRSTTALEGDDDYRMQLISAAWEFGANSSVIETGSLRVYQQFTDVGQRTLDERGLAARPVAINRYFRFEQSVRGVDLGMHRSLTVGEADHRISAGIEFRERTTEEYRDGLERGLIDGATTNVILGEVFPLRDFPRSKTRDWGAYIEDTVTTGNWSMTAAVRADRYSLTPLSDAMYAEDYPFARPVSVSEFDVSPRLALMLHVGEASEIYLQYVQGFRAPPYEEANIGLEIPVFNYRAIPNPDLRSESSEGFELGVRWRGEYLRWHVAAFRTDYDSFIESRVRTGIDPDSGRILFQAQNIDRALISGLEAGWEWQLTGALQSFRIDGSIYAARGENRASMQPLNSVGPAQAIGGLAWTAADDRRAARLQVTRTAAWTDRDETRGEVFKPGAHTLLDAYVTQRIGERATLRLGVLNILDRRAWHWSSVRGLSVDDVLIPHLSQPGRSIAVSVGMNW